MKRFHYSEYTKQMMFSEKNQEFEGTLLKVDIDGRAAHNNETI